MNIKSISEQQLKEPVVRVKPIHSGYVSDAYSVSTRERRYFLKVSREPVLPDFFLPEKEGLSTLKENFGSNVPQVINVFEVEDLQFLLMEFVESGVPHANFWTTFGHKLAGMHQNTHQSFGWDSDNYIGALAQKNKWDASWVSFFAENRILPLVQQLTDLGFFSTAQLTQAEKLCAELDNILPKERPALIHGDLWSGNFLVDKKGLPVLIDPSISFSHREMDIAMTKLFGGFPREFYESYEQRFPLATGWETRLPVTQLYPLLVHAALFGGSYISRCKETLARF